MKFGVGIIPQDNIEETINLVKLAEDVGFEYAWISHRPNKNIYSLLEKISDETTTIKIGPGVTNPYVKKPKNSAFEIMNIHNASNKRAIFGIGPGNKEELQQLKIHWKKPVQALKEHVAVFRQSFADEDCNIPIYIGAQSPKLLEIAGKIADGALINASHPKDFEELLDYIQKGNNNNLSDFDVAAYTATSIGDDIESAKNAARIVVAFIIAGSAPHILERHDLPKKLSEDIYVSLSKGDIGGAIRLVNDDLLDIFSVTGTSKEIIPKVESLQKAGVTQFVVGAPIGKEMDASLKLFENVISSF